MANESVFVRYPGNPIVTAQAVPTANTIFNSAAVPFGKGYAGVFRIDDNEILCWLHAGFSDDGIHWKINPDHIQLDRSDPDLVANGRGYDPRVTEIDGVYYITWCHYPAGGGPAIGLAKTTDFRRFHLLADIVQPFNRNAVLFPRKIDGMYAILHRPSDTGHTPFGEIFYATSPDLVRWGPHRFVFGTDTRTSWWQSTKVGPGPTPIETKEGWLVIYHGVRQSCSGFIYCAGGAILDLEKPWKVLYRSKAYLLAPTAEYERVGDTPNVIFPCGAIVDKTGKLALYYGAADTSVCLAHAQVDDVISFIKKHS